MTLGHLKSHALRIIVFKYDQGLFTNKNVMANRSTTFFRKKNNGQGHLKAKIT